MIQVPLYRHSWRFRPHGGYCQTLYRYCWGEYRYSSTGIDTYILVSIHLRVSTKVELLPSSVSILRDSVSILSNMYRYLCSLYRYIWGFVHSIDTHVLGIDTCLKNVFCKWLKHISMICLSTFKDLFQFKTKYKVKYQFNLSLLVISKLNSRLTISPFLI